VLRHALVIFAKDLRQRLRDRTALLVGVVVPLAMAGLMGVALGDAEEGYDLDVAIAAAPGDARAAAFAAWLERPDLAGIRLHANDVATAREQVESGELDAGLAFEAGGLRVLASQREVFAARTLQASVDRFLAEAEAAAPGAPAPAQAIPRSPGGELRMLDYFGPSMAVLFLTFAVLSGVRALENEKQSGALARLAAAPVHPLSVLGAKFAALLAMGLVQMTVMIAATSLLFGTRWGAPLPLAALVASSAFMAVGLTSFFMAWAGSAERGVLVANLGIFALSIVGGQFMPPQGLPDVFETLQRLTPNGQAARGFVDLAAAGPEGGLRVLAEPLLATFAVGLAGVAYGVRRARGALHRAAG
jgi:ABC-2 type transport system permease protein